MLSFLPYSLSMSLACSSFGWGWTICNACILSKVYEIATTFLLGS